jgi:Concanavalin A-like lectin/glucanases superfamily
MRARTVLLATAMAGAVAMLPSLARSTPAADAAVSPSIVLFYKFNTHQGTSVIDSSASQLNGTLINVAAPDSAYVTGRTGYGKALNLVAAQRQYVAVPEGSALDVNKFTLAALVKYTGVQTPDTLDRWEVLEKAGAYWLNIRTNGLIRAGGFFGACNQTANWKFLDSTVAVPTNTWSHVAATYNGAKLTLYVNGAAAGSLNVSGTTCSNDEPLAVGAKNAPSKGILEAFWDGQLDDVRIYNKALTATQIANLAP